jgi:hypothetical protein
MAEEQKLSYEDFFVDDKEAFFTFAEQEYSIEDLTVDEEIQNVELYTDEKGKTNPQLASIFELTKLKKVPFTRESIKAKIGIDKDWVDLTLKQRMDFLKQFKSTFLSGLIASSRKATKKDVVEAEVKN